jgi:hypothetical protein
MLSPPCRGGGREDVVGIGGMLKRDNEEVLLVEQMVVPLLARPVVLPSICPRRILCHQIAWQGTHNRRGRHIGFVAFLVIVGHVSAS